MNKQQNVKELFGFDLRALSKKIYEQRKNCFLEFYKFSGIKPKEKILLERLLLRRLDLDTESLIVRIDQMCQERQQRLNQQVRYANENNGSRWTVKIQDRERRAKKRF